jgi:phosphohistidine phosphatase
MFLYLVQHAEAKREEEDPARPLSEKGLQDIARVAAYITQLNIKIDKIFHSAKLSAKQTAGMLCENLKPMKGISEVDGLSPLDDPHSWAERLKDLREDVMLVGHLPHLARLASLLLSGNADKNIVSFQMGGIVCLKKDDTGIWSLHWMLIPGVIVGEKGIGYSCDGL